MGQVSNFGLHRGFFAKKFPETSFRLVYMLPSLFVLFLLGGGVASYFIPAIRTPFLLIVALYLFVSLLSALPSKRLIPMVLAGIVATHVVYGLSFLVGLSKGDLKR